MKITFQLEGAKELDANLATLPARVQKSVVRASVREAQRPMLARAKANAAALPESGIAGPDMSALISANVVLRVKRKNQPGTYAMEVRLRGQNEGGPSEFRHKTKSGREYWVPAAIEFGHGADKASAARPYMRPAADNTIEQTKRILADELGKGILREAIKGRYK